MTTPEVDAVVVGSGLAGLTAALQVLDKGGSVILVEKEAKLGGNSIKASSGINACVPTTPGNSSDVSQDEMDSFLQDTLKSAGDRARPELVRILVENSAESLQWLVDRIDINLFDNRTRLGGHSRERTHRPAKGTIGFSLISAMQKALEPYQDKGSLKILLSTKALELVQEEEPNEREDECIARVSGVKVQSEEDGEIILEAKNVVLATGGFAAARGKDSYLARFAPAEYLEMPATFGEFSTGDGIAMAESLGAGKIDMDKVQIHPTGFVDLQDPSNPYKILCAELMRGVGGILLNAHGKRFCNELGTRDYVTSKMMEQRKGSKDTPFYLLLPSTAAKKAEAHIGFYSWKGLLKQLVGIDKVAESMNVDPGTLHDTLIKYNEDAKVGNDLNGKAFFPDTFQEDLDTATYYVGSVTPVLHYCMGGLSISKTGNILNENGQVIPGLYGAGEVSGGVHGCNRLAGNSLLECLVFGRIVGQQIIESSNSSNNAAAATAAVSPVAKTALDAIQAKYSAVIAGYDPMVADCQELYQELLEDMLAKMDRGRKHEGDEQKPRKRKPQTPLVNAGYECRVLAMSHRIQAFLLYHQMTTTTTRRRIQLVVLGCGLDVIGMWAAKSFNPTPSSSILDLTVVEIDTLEIYQHKRDILRSSGSGDIVQNLTEHDAGDDGSSQHCSGTFRCVQNDSEGVTLSSPTPQADCHRHDYCLIPVDLTEEMSRLDAILKDPSIPFSPTAPTLIVSELVLAYLPPTKTDQLLTWCADKFASIPGSAVVAIEPLGYDSGNGTEDVVSVYDGYRRDYCNKFQDKMQRGVQATRGGGPSGEVRFYPMGTAVESVTERLREDGFAKASTTTLGVAATIAAAATSPTKTLACPEMFDEHAALSLHLQSYVVACGVSPAKSNDNDAFLFGRVMCPWQCGTNALQLARSCLPWFDCYDKTVYSEIQLEHEDRVRSLFEATYQEYTEAYPAIRKMVKTVLKKELKQTHPSASTSQQTVSSEFARPSSIAEFYRSNNGIFLVAVRYGDEDEGCDKEVVGFVGVRSCEAKHEESGTMEIFRLAVDERYRGRGIARNLLAAVEMYVLDQNCPKLVANTLTILDTAANLYSSHGFIAEKEARLGPQLDMITFAKMPGVYEEDEVDESNHCVDLEQEVPQSEQSDYERLGYEQAEPTVYQRKRRGSLLGHILAWADTVNQEHIESNFEQSEQGESTGNRTPRRNYGRRGSLDATFTDPCGTRGARSRRRVRSSDDFDGDDGKDSDESIDYDNKRAGSQRRNSLDAFVEQAVAYRNLRPDPNDDEMCPFGTRRDSLF